MKKTVCIMIICLLATDLFFVSCQKNESDKIADLNVIDVSKKTNFDYWVVANDGGNFFVDLENEKPVSVFFTPDIEKDGYPIYFDSCGFPDKAIINGYTFIFRNFDSTQVDIAVIYPDGTINVARKVAISQNLKSLSLKSASTSDWLRWTGNAIGAVSCGIGIATLPETFGLSSVITYTGCGSTILSIATEFLPQEYNVLGMTSTGISAITTAAGCSGSVSASCITGLASTSFNVIAAGFEHLEEISSDVDVTSSALEYGYGDIQITLSWNNIADLDLHVFDPSGNEIYWENKSSSTGGRLDVDDINGFGPENIYWAEGTAPLGTYEVYVHHFPWALSSYQILTGNSYYPSTADYTVLVNAFGKIKKYTGSTSFDESVHIVSFDQNGLKSGSLKSARTITKHQKH